MLPITKAARLRAFSVSRNGAAMISSRTARSLHSRPSHNSAEAAAAAQPATHEVEYSPSVLRDIAARRAKAGKLVAGIAAASDSDRAGADLVSHLSKLGSQKRSDGTVCLMAINVFCRHNGHTLLSCKILWLT
jgi:hypothetical protein